MRIVGAVFLIVLLSAFGLGSIALAQYGFYFGPAWLCRVKNEAGHECPSIFLIFTSVVCCVAAYIGVVAVGINTNWKSTEP